MINREGDGLQIQTTFPNLWEAPRESPSCLQTAFPSRMIKYISNNQSCSTPFSPRVGEVTHKSFGASRRELVLSILNRHPQDRKPLPLLNPNERVDLLSLQRQAGTFCQCASRALCAGLFPWTSWACQGSVPTLNSASCSTAPPNLALFLETRDVL